MVRTFRVLDGGGGKTRQKKGMITCLQSLDAGAWGGGERFGKMNLSLKSA